MDPGHIEVVGDEDQIRAELVGIGGNGVAEGEGACSGEALFAEGHAVLPAGGGGGEFDFEHDGVGLGVVAVDGEFEVGAAGGVDGLGQFLARLHEEHRAIHHGEAVVERGFPDDEGFGGGTPVLGVENPIDATELDGHRLGRAQRPDRTGPGIGRDRGDQPDDAHGFAEQDRAGNHIVARRAGTRGGRIAWNAAASAAGQADRED